LFGPVLGAIAVGYGRTALSEKFPTQWTYFQGALFIVVILLLPGGVASLWPKLKSRWPRGAVSVDNHGQPEAMA
jgi:urea transport system permease protein